MAKTNFIDANPSQGILGTLVTASFLNKLGLHRHDGLDDDGHCPLDYYVAGGTANALTVTCNPELTQHVPGMPIHIKVAATNTGAVTINFNGLGNVSLTKFGGEALAPGDLVAGQVIKVVNVDQSSYSMLSPVAGGNLQRTIGVSAATTLGPEQTGSLIILSGSSAFTVTLPAPASGRKLVFFNANSQSITLRTPSGIFAGYGLGGVNTFSVPAATSLTLVADGNNWVVSSYFGSITSAMIADGAVTNNKIADGTIWGNSKIADGSISGQKLADGTIWGNSKIADGSISGQKLANDASITNAKIADGAVTNNKIADGTIWGSNKIADGSISGLKLADGTIWGHHKIADGSITWQKFAAGEWNSGSYFQQIPTGTMIMFGSSTGTSISNLVTFPIAFTTTPYVVLSLIKGSSDIIPTVVDGSITATGFSWSRASSNASGVVVNWVAFGKYK